MKFKVTDSEFQMAGRISPSAPAKDTSIPAREDAHPTTFNYKLSTLNSGFTLIEVLVVVTLLSLIVAALMSVFSTTQAAFRSSITQRDVLEGGREAADMIAAELRQATPSFDSSTVNFYVNTNYYQEMANGTPLVQSLVASTFSRTNVLQTVFFVTRQNMTWTGIGYMVDATSTNYINPLYRFVATTNVQSGQVSALYTIFANQISAGAWTNFSHLIDGVVDLRVRAYDRNGVWLTNNFIYYNGAYTTNTIRFLPSALGEENFFMMSNTLPASVELQLGILEDRTIQRAESRPFGPVRGRYLSDHAGQVHLFRQRVMIPNFDPSAFQ